MSDKGASAVASQAARVITREVPVPCEVCKLRGYRPEDVDDPDGSWRQCDACQGRGWLFITETIHEDALASRTEEWTRDFDGIEPGPVEPLP